MTSRIRIITGYDSRMQSMGELTSATWMRWAKLHGYEFVRHSSLGDVTPRHPSWGKLRLLLQGIVDGYTCVWVDADSVAWDLRATVPGLLEQARGDMRLLVARDPYGACCSHLIAQPGSWSEAFLAGWSCLGDSMNWRRHHSSPKWEQDALKIMLENFQEIRDRVGLLTSDTVCHVGEPEPWTWAVHASGPDLNARMARLKRFAQVHV